MATPSVRLSTQVNESPTASSVDQLRLVRRTGSRGPHGASSRLVTVPRGPRRRALRMPETWVRSASPTVPRTWIRLTWAAAGGLPPGDLTESEDESHRELWADLTSGLDEGQGRVITAS